jgi:hypothetical protein
VVAGLTEIEAPEPTAVPPQLPLYHCHEAPVPKEPPFSDNVVELPEQIGFTDALALVAAFDEEFTVTVT